MRAAVVRKFREPLVIEERPIPEPGPGEVRVHIETSGVCHTDIQRRPRRLAHQAVASAGARS